MLTPLISRLNELNNRLMALNVYLKDTKCNGTYEIRIAASGIKERIITLEKEIHQLMTRLYEDSLKHSAKPELLLD